MHLHTTIGEDEIQNDETIKGFLTEAEIEVGQASKCEIWCTDFSDPGGDYCEFRFFKPSSTTPFFVKKQEGY